MVQIKYGDYHEIAELAGKTVAEVRQQYKPLLNIPDRAKTKLNDRGINRKLESETVLKDDDTLRFVEASRKGPFFILAALLALGATAIPFAFAQTTATISANVTEKDDFVSVAAASPSPTWDVYGKFKGSVGSGGELFKITPGTDFTGDMACSVVIGNAEELVECYRVLVMTISIYEDDGSGTAANTASQIGTTEYLTLSKGEIDITMEDLSGKTSPFWVYLDGGFYITHYWGTYSPSGDEDPLLYCDVVQKGT
jgi:molybdopterin converting factor small subunit